MRPLRIFISHPSHYLTDNQPHGDGLLANSLLRALAARGHQLHVPVVLADLATPMPPNVHLHPMRLWSPLPTSDQGPLFRAEYALRVRAMFQRLSRVQRFDLIHQLNPVVTGLSSLLFHLGTPVVLGPIWPAWQHAGEKSRWRERLEQRILRHQYHNASAILSPTPASGVRVPREEHEAGKVFAFPLGIATEPFLAARQRPPKPPTVLFLANLQERKGIFTLLDAFERVARAMPEARLRIAGSGAETARVRRWVERSKARARIEMLGNIPRSQIAATLATCTVYCLPSFGEPYGISALEAMAAGKPLVVTRAGGLMYLVPDGGALKVPPGDAEALAGALTRLLRDPAACARMGAYNQRHVERYHAWDRVMDRLESIYAALQGGPVPEQIGSCCEDADAALEEMRA